MKMPLFGLPSLLALSLLLLPPGGGSAMAAEEAFVIGPEDVLDIQVWDNKDLNQVTFVRPDGKISLPLVGEIQATGRTAIEVQAEITSKLIAFIADPVVSVIVKEINSPKISVFGEVRRPDVFPIKQRMTVLDGIARAGGFTEFARRDRVIVIRAGSSGQERIKLNLERLIKDGAPFYLQASDTVFVE